VKVFVNGEKVNILRDVWRYLSGQTNKTQIKCS